MRLPSKLQNAIDAPGKIAVVAAVALCFALAALLTAVGVAFTRRGYGYAD